MMSLYIDIDRIIHSLKTALACIIGFTIIKVMPFPSDQWILISIIVVMCAQIRVGGTLHRAYMRFFGTLLGCLFASFALLIFGNDNIVLYATTAIACFVFSYIATSQDSLNYAGTLGAVTTMVVLMTPHPTTTIAAERFLEISLGIFIATVVSVFILPINARYYLRRTQALTLRELQHYYAQALTKNISVIETPLQELDSNIVKLFTKQRELAKEAIREPMGIAFDPLEFAQMLQDEIVMLRAIFFMHHALENITVANSHEVLALLLSDFHHTVDKVFTSLIKTIDSNYQVHEAVSLPSPNVLQKMIEQNLDKFTFAERTSIDGFLFATEVFVDNLSKLVTLCKLPLVTSEP